MDKPTATQITVMDIRTLAETKFIRAVAIKACPVGDAVGPPVRETKRWKQGLAFYSVGVIIKSDVGGF